MVGVSDVVCFDDGASDDDVTLTDGATVRDCGVRGVMKGVPEGRDAGDGINVGGTEGFCVRLLDGKYVGTIIGFGVGLEPTVG